MPAGGSENDRSSISRRSPKPLVRCSTSMTVSPSRSPGGIWISRRLPAALGGLGLGEQLLVGAEAGLRLRLPRLGRHADPLELSLEGLRPRRVGLLLPAEPVLLLLEPARVVALERDAAAPVELEDPAGDVVEEVAVVGDGHDGAGVVAAGSAPARPPTRRRGGWWARRAAAGRAWPAGAGRGRRGAARRPTASSRRRRRAGGAGRPWRSRSGGRGRWLPSPRSRLRGGPAPRRSSRSRHRGRRTWRGRRRTGASRSATAPTPSMTFALDVLVRVEVGLLLEQADGEAGGEAGLAGVAVVDPRHDPQQRRLARSRSGRCTPILAPG